MKTNITDNPLSKLTKGRESIQTNKMKDEKGNIEIDIKKESRQSKNII